MREKSFFFQKALLGSIAAVSIQNQKVCNFKLILHSILAGLLIGVKQNMPCILLVISCHRQLFVTDNVTDNVRYSSHTIWQAFKEI